MVVGDIDSKDSGSGARYNAGKDPLDLIPVRVWGLVWRNSLTVPERSALHSISQFQEGNDGALDGFFQQVSQKDMDVCAKVFMYGSDKYKEWNWAKGMQWSVPTGCILRHFRAIVSGEEIDRESRLPHLGHILSNMVMLSWYSTHYKEGDNRPPVKGLVS